MHTHTHTCSNTRSDIQKTYTQTRICMHMQVHMHLCMYIHTHVHMCKYAQAHIINALHMPNTHVCTRITMCMLTRPPTHMYSHMYTCTPVHTTHLYTLHLYTLHTCTHYTPVHTTHLYTLHTCTHYTHPALIVPQPSSSILTLDKTLSHCCHKKTG